MDPRNLQPIPVYGLKADFDVAIQQLNQVWSWMFTFGMWLILIATVAIFIWIMADSQRRAATQQQLGVAGQALAVRISSFLGILLVLPVFVFRFTGSVPDWMTVQFYTFDTAKGKNILGVLMKNTAVPYNINWLMKGYGPTFCYLALLGLAVSAVSAVVYRTIVDPRRHGNTVYGQVGDVFPGAETWNTPETPPMGAEMAGGYTPPLGTPAITADTPGTFDYAPPTPAPAADFVAEPPTPTVVEGPAGHFGGAAAGMGQQVTPGGTIIDDASAVKTFATVHLVQGKGTGQSWDLPAGEAIIGRDPSTSSVVLDDPKVSKQHAKVKYENANFVLYDLGSTNKTHVNGVAVSAPQILQDDDKIKLGDTVLVFKRVQA